MKKQRWWFEGTREKVEALKHDVVVEKAHNGGEMIDAMLRLVRKGHDKEQYGIHLIKANEGLQECYNDLQRIEIRANKAESESERFKNALKFIASEVGNSVWNSYSRNDLLVHISNIATKALEKEKGE